MSFEPDDIEGGINIETMLSDILRELRLLNVYIKEMTGFEITKDDIDE